MFDLLTHVRQRAVSMPSGVLVCDRWPFVLTFVVFSLNLPFTESVHAPLGAFSFHTELTSALPGSVLFLHSRVLSRGGANRTIPVTRSIFQCKKHVNK